MVQPRLAMMVRNFATSAARLSHFHGGVPGENLPFDTTNKYKLTLFFSLYFGSGIAFPFIMLRHQLTKK